MDLLTRDIAIVGIGQALTKVFLPDIPAVQVYSREPAVVGVRNSLICYLNNFQPPEVKVELLKNGAVIPGGVQSDLMFEQKWQYHLTKTAPILIKEGDRYACRITHVGRTTTHHWGEFSFCSSVVIIS